ncbi:MAG: L-seryl-tRNA(Sec) selenium transferase [Planctomycetota bacterium]
MDEPQNPLRSIPSVSRLLADPAVQSRAEGLSHAEVVRAVRTAVDARRADLQSSDPRQTDLVADILDQLDRVPRNPLPPVINATGVLLHTGLGRAPLTEAAAEAVAQAARNYVPLEIELATGDRGRRADTVRPLLTALTGADSAAVVNNGAAALVLALAAVAADKEVIVSRGELIEIGGGFRLPEIMQASGARLVEVGTTNRTRLADYRRAIGPDTAAVLKVHPSNYRITGFSESIDVAPLAALAREHELPMLFDAGSGALADQTQQGLPAEPSIQAAVADGAHLTMFSGDKLLGGSQAGLIVGHSDWVRRCETHPLMRAFRVDKLTLAALAAVLRAHADAGPSPEDQSPVAIAAATESLDTLRCRAESILAQLAGLESQATVSIEPAEAYLGGGSTPDAAIESIALRVAPATMTEDRLAERLRTGPVPVVPRLRDGAVWLDLRSVFPRQDEPLAAALRQALGSETTDD